MVLQAEELPWCSVRFVHLFSHQCFLRGNFTFSGISLFFFKILFSLWYKTKHIPKLENLEVMRNRCKSSSKVFGCLWASLCPVQETKHTLGPRCRALHAQNVRVTSKQGIVLHHGRLKLFFSPPCSTVAVCQQKSSLRRKHTSERLLSTLLEFTGTQLKMHWWYLRQLKRSKNWVKSWRMLIVFELSA